MRWLHLTDIHIGNSNTNQTNAIAALAEGIESHMPDRDAFDAIIITGDLAWSGKTTDYEHLAPLINQLRSLPQLSASAIIAVPGNHDQDCDEVAASPWDLQPPNKKAQFFDNGHIGTKTRRSHARGFSAYDAFATHANIQSLTATRDCATRLNVEIPDITLFAVNTALLCHKDTEEPSPFPTPALRELLAQQDHKNRILVLGHHPLDTNDSASDSLRTLLDDHGILYLHGHTHKISARLTHAGGIRELGFGASYIEGPDNQASIPYRNSFAYCSTSSEGLHTQFCSWDAHNGTWAPETALPSEFRTPSPLWTFGRLIPLPEPLKRRRSPKSAKTQIASLLQTPLTSHQWKPLLHSLRLIGDDEELRELAPDQNNPTRFLAYGRTNSESTTLYFLASDTQEVSRDDVARIHSEADAERANAVCVVSFAPLSPGAHQLYQKLAQTRQYSLWTNEKISEKLFNSTRTTTRTHDKAVTHLFHGDTAIYVVHSHDDQSYSLATLDTGITESADSPVVDTFCRRFGEWSQRRYYESTAPNPQKNDFEPQLYIEACAKIFNEVRYAGLAAVGVRLQEALLTDVYVASNADHPSSHDEDEHISRAITEYLESLGLDDSQRATLEEQLRQHYGIIRSTEVDSTHAWYRTFGHLFVLGDPGAGKSFFIKREILFYARRETPWHAVHVPIYIPLAELEAVLKEVDKVSDETLLASIASVLEGRSLRISASTISDLLLQGNAALFFDGLDEIVSPEARAGIVKAFSRLFEQHSKTGNRFVLSSRPAAAIYAAPPKSLRRIILRGLSDSEMRVLAERVLSTMAGDKGLAAADHAVIAAIVADCQRSPGIRRLAQNPLLLSLLVVIYANSGAPAARRHRIYTQAVQTLVSIRNREVGRQTLSETDLRNRLGRLALATFERTVSELPTKSEVLGVFSAALREEGLPDTDCAAAAHEFLISVATSTGLLIISARGEGEAVVTFMHQSFREYYAACQAAKSEYLSKLPEWIRYPRWREVISLMSGLLSDSTDVSDLFDVLLGGGAAEYTIAGSRLTFAIECAIECDVPPDKVQRKLYEAVRREMADGAGSCDPLYREDLAAKLLLFARNAGMTRLESALVSGIGEKNPSLAASFIDLSMRLCREADLPLALAAIRAAWSRTERAIRLASLGSIGALAQLQDQAAVELVRECLSGSVVLKHAALTAMLSFQDSRIQLGTELQALAGGANAFLGSIAAGVLLEGRDASEYDGPESKARLRATVGSLLRGARGERELPRFRVDPLQVQVLCRSGDTDERVLGFRMLLWLSNESGVVYQLCTSALTDKNGSNDLILQSLIALRMNESARSLFTWSDRDHVLELAERGGRRDVRVAAIRLLRTLPLDEVAVRKIGELALDMSRASGFDSEMYRVALSTAAAHVTAGEADWPLKVAKSLLDAYRRRGTFGDLDRKRICLALDSIGEGSGSIADIERDLWSFADNYRIPLQVRRSAVRALCNSMDISRDSLERLLSLFRTRTDLSRAISRGLLTILRRAHENVTSVRAIVTIERRLVDGLLTAWRRRKGQTGVGDDAELRSMREAMDDLLGLTAAYAEYAARARLAPSSNSGNRSRPTTE